VYEADGYTELAALTEGEYAALDWDNTGKMLAGGRSDGSIVIWGIAGSTP
jgi:hypothetical protein